MTELLLRLFVKDRSDTTSPAARGRYGMLSSAVGIVCNICLFLLKFILGTLSNSVAVAADAFNNLSDVGSSLMTMVGFKMAAKPADRDHPFGHGRAEYVSGLIVALLILIVGVEMGKTSVIKIFYPETVTFSYVVVAGLVASIFVKLWMGLFNRKLGKKINSAAMRATSVDSISDACATCATLISVIAARFTNFPVDGLMGVVVSVMILAAGYGVARDTLNPLLGQKPDPHLVDEITRRLLAYDGILGIHDLIVHDYGPTRRMASVHAEVSMHRDILVSHDLIDRAERQISKDLGLEIVVHMDPIETDCTKTNELRQLTERLVQEIDSAYSIHDFRMVYGGELSNFIFDIMVPFECKQADADITQAIDQRLKQINPNYTAVVHVDRSYC